MIRIIHISDFHLETESPSFEKKAIVTSLIVDIGKYADANTAIFFTGDFVDKGGMGFIDKTSMFTTFEELVLTPIVSQYPVFKNKIFLVAGNHDVLRNKIDTITEAGLKASLINPKNVSKFISENRNSSKHLDRLSDYKAWEMSFYNSYPNSNLSLFENSFTLRLDGVSVGITCLNSSWLCKDENDKENLIIGKCQLDHSLEIIKDCDIKLALCHHPLEFLTSFDRDSIKPDLYKNYDALFTGHVHELDSLYTQNLFGNIFISIANSTIADSRVEKKYVNGYTVIEIYPSEKIKAIYRKYLDEHKSFVPNTDIGTEDGTKDFPILQKEKLSRFESGAKIIEHIENQYADKLNEHLILSTNNNNVHYSIDNLFVEPTLLNCPEHIFNENDTVSYTVESILCGDANFIIYGLTESGKTLLLDKFFLEASRKYNEIEKIPVLIKFSECKPHGLFKVVKEFIGLNASQTEHLLKNNKLLLLVDDLSFNTKNISQVNTLKEFIREYPNIQVIATADQIFENVIPTDYLPHNNELKLELAFIQSFTSTQIRQLIGKWFVGKNIDFQDSLEKLLKNFADFGLPKTPLSVTLFLWIIEKQEKRPINNSVLVELFIENLLEKANIDNVYSETFDFKNKQRLLSFVAKFMKEKGNSDLSYCVNYVDLLTYINNYLKTRFPGQPQKVLDDFIKRGIFSYEEDNLIRFKSPFFFHYFLALHFDYDFDFKQHVFTGDNYLDYVDEIIYYTGLKRDDVYILKFTQEKLQEAFSEFNKQMALDYQRLDKVLDTSQDVSNTFALQIDEEKMKIKPTQKDLDKMYDEQLSQIPIQKNISKKESENLSTQKNIDRVLKLAASVLKNSEDVDDFSEKVSAYKNIISSSMSFLVQYRDTLIKSYLKYQKTPEYLPKNVDFSLFIRVLPLVHQVVVYNWVGSQKLRPVIIEKINNDSKSLNVSDYEKFLSVFIYSDIKGNDYPEKIQQFVKFAKYNYIKDLTFFKVMLYYHLRSKDETLDQFYLKLLADIRADLGFINKNAKTQFMKGIEERKNRK